MKLGDSRALARMPYRGSSPAVALRAHCHHRPARSPRDLTIGGHGETWQAIAFLAKKWEDFREPTVSILVVSTPLKKWEDFLPQFPGSMIFWQFSPGFTPSMATPKRVGSSGCSSPFGNRDQSSSHWICREIAVENGENGGEIPHIALIDMLIIIFLSIMNIVQPRKTKMLSQYFAASSWPRKSLLQDGGLVGCPALPWKKSRDFWRSHSELMVYHGTNQFLLLIFWCGLTQSVPYQPWRFCKPIGM